MFSGVGTGDRGGREASRGSRASQEVRGVGKRGVSPGSDYGEVILIMGAERKERPQQKVY